MTCVNGIVAEGAVHDRVDAIALEAEARMIPLNAMVELTYRCNIDCLYCYCQHLTGDTGRTELQTDEWKRVLDELARLGVLHLAITGGEILVRRDFWEIAGHAKTQHFSLTLFTNGTLIDDMRADRLAALRPTSIEMSLLGATEESHDRATKVKGSWRRMMRATELLRARNLPFVFKTTLMTENIDEQNAIRQVAVERGCRTYKVGVDVSPRNDGNREPQRYQITPRAMFDYFIDERSGPMQFTDELPREQAIQKGTCGAAVSGCAVNPYGDFLPCIQLMIPFGNVRERSLADMWRNPPPELQRVRDTKRYGQMADCAACDVVDYCARCHGLAHLETGRWDSCYRQALETAEVARAAVRYRRDGIEPRLAASPAVRRDGGLVQLRL